MDDKERQRITEKWEKFWTPLKIHYRKHGKCVFIRKTKYLTPEEVHHLLKSLVGKCIDAIIYDFNYDHIMDTYLNHLDQSPRIIIGTGIGIHDSGPDEGEYVNSLIIFEDRRFMVTMGDIHRWMTENKADRVYIRVTKRQGNKRRMIGPDNSFFEAACFLDIYDSRKELAKTTWSVMNSHSDKKLLDMNVGRLIFGYVA